MKKFLLLLLFIPFISLAQTDSIASKPNKDIFDRIFGCDSILVYGTATIYPGNDHKIVYSREQCSITCSGSNNNKLWNRDLTSLNCKLIGFSYRPQYKKKLKGCDIWFQLDNKKLYGLKSKNGRIKYLKKLNRVENQKAKHH
ncbi:MAG: hypothetical protein JWP12_2338 [Bacteroidetes bacterium]|nr:hypothetical protein [Bacteroidota bacterium]